MIRYELVKDSLDNSCTCGCGCGCRRKCCRICLFEVLSVVHVPEAPTPPRRRHSNLVDAAIVAVAHVGASVVALALLAVVSDPRWSSSNGGRNAVLTARFG